MPHRTTGRYAGYDPFAWIYSRDWGAEYHAQALDVLDRALLNHIPPPARILDLCCGDGRIAAQLTARGYSVVGIDGSEEMLRYARERCPAATFVLDDARSFAMPPEFDLVISTFDSLNHVMSTRELRMVFRNVREALVPGGCFVFDVNEECAYTELWVWPYTRVQDDRAFIARGTYDREMRVAQCDVTVFRREDGKWERSDFTLLQRHHTDDEIRSALDREGFVDIDILDAQQDLEMRGGIAYGRVYVRARRPLGEL